MTLQEALDYNEQLTKQLMLESEELGLENPKKAAEMIEEHIMIYPDDDRRDMIFLDERGGKSYKAGNVLLDLRKFIISTLEFSASLSIPQMSFNYVQLFIKGLLYVRRITEKSLSDIEAAVVLYLHKQDAYQNGIEEQRLIETLVSWCKEQLQKTFEKEKIEEALSQLMDMSAITIVDGKVYMREKVFVTR